MKYLTFLTLIFCVCNPALHADQITLSNGDRLTGKIVKSDGKTLVIKTDLAGEVTVQWPAIQEIHSTQNLHVDAKDGRKAEGEVGSTDGNLIVHTPNQALEIPKDQVADVRNPEEQAAYDRSQHPSLTQGWTGGANVGFALTAGNSETKNLALAFTGDRKSPNDHVALYANSVYATSNAAGLNATTANSSQSGIRYERNLTSRLFAFVSGDFQTDALQSLDLRSVFGAGFGYHAIKNDRTTLDLLGGANYTREDYSTLQRNVAALTLGEELTRKLGGTTLVTQKLYFYPAVSDLGDYRSTFNLGTVTKISKWLGWQNAFGDIYVTNPPLGKKRNDITLTTGLAVTFAH